MSELLTGTVVSVKEVLVYLRNDLYMTLPVAAQYLAMSKNSLRAKLADVPHFVRGNRLVFKRSELDGWMETQRVEIDDVAAIVQEVCGDA